MEAERTVGSPGETWECLAPASLLGGAETSESGYILKVETIGFADSLVKVRHQGLGLNN